MPGTTPYELRPDPGLPVPAYRHRYLPGADAPQAPPGGGAALRSAGAGYWTRRGLPTGPDHVTAAPGAELLLLSLLSAVGGDVVLARPAPAWVLMVAGLRGGRVHAAPTPAEGGGVPDPFALLETVRRVRARGGAPRVVVLSPADDPTGTVTPPEMMHETCEAAAEAGLLIISDETYGDTLHRPGSVHVSPAEIVPDQTVLLTDLGASLMPGGLPVAFARHPDTAEGRKVRDRSLRRSAGLRARLSGPVAAEAAYVLGEPDEVLAGRAAANRLHAAVAAAAHGALTSAGARCRPPQAGFQLYPEVSGHVPGGADALERHLSGRLGRPVLGGHRFGDDPAALRVRIDTGALYGRGDEERAAVAAAPDPTAVPHVAAGLAELGEAFAELAAGALDDARDQDQDRDRERERERGPGSRSGQGLAGTG